MAGVGESAASAARWDQISQMSEQLGIDAIGVCPVEVLEPARTVLAVRKEAGLQASMQFTYRNPERSTDPARILEGAQSIVVAALGYRHRTPAPPSGLSGRVARYSWRDTYGDLRSHLETIGDALRSEGFIARVHLDDNSLVDRNVAYNAGLGWYGKNANLLLPGRGSWFVLGSIVTDAELPPTGPPAADGCGPCTRCLDDCPTDAIIAPGVVDARRCLAWLVQGPGEIPVEFREALGDRLYGCDDCQDVCPPNKPTTAPPDPPDDADPWIELEFVLTADDDELMARVGRWYLARRDPNVVRRTALVVLGNIGSAEDPLTVELVTRYLHHENPILAEHAAWSAARLGLRSVAS